MHTEECLSILLPPFSLTLVCALQLCGPCWMQVMRPCWWKCSKLTGDSLAEKAYILHQCRHKRGLTQRQHATTLQADTVTSATYIGTLQTWWLRGLHLPSIYKTNIMLYKLTEQQIHTVCGSIQHSNAWVNLFLTPGLVTTDFITSCKHNPQAFEMIYN